MPYLGINNFLGGWDRDAGLRYVGDDGDHVDLVVHHRRGMCQLWRTRGG